MPVIIETPRLRLRPPVLDDCADIVGLISDWQVVRWLSSPPYPYGARDAHHFVTEIANDRTYAIEIDGAFAGIVSILSELGYWLGRPYWQHGYMTEAAGALVADHFRVDDTALVSGHFLGNQGSCNVLTKLGFRGTHLTETFAKPLQRSVKLQRMSLIRADWEAAQTKLH